MKRVVESEEVVHFTVTQDNKVIKWLAASNTCADNIPSANVSIYSVQYYSKRHEYDRQWCDIVPQCKLLLSILTALGKKLSLGLFGFSWYGSLVPTRRQQVEEMGAGVCIVFYN